MSGIFPIFENKSNNSMLNFRLKVFYSVAINLSFTKAALELYITQPAVTKNIKELEKELKISLFERSKGGINLTKAGKILLKYTEQQLEQSKSLEYEIGTLRNSLFGELHIGASTTIGQYILPPILANFNRKYPDIKIVMHNKNTLDIEKDLSHKDIDLGVVEGNIKLKEFKYIPFMKDEIVAIAHTSQTISEKSELTLEELKNTLLVVREIGSGSLDVIVEALKEKNIRLKDMNVLMYLGSTESIKTFLAHSNCISFVSIHAVSKQIAKGEFKIIDIVGLDIVRPFKFIYPQGSQHGLIEKFIDFSLRYDNL